METAFLADLRELLSDPQNKKWLAGTLGIDVLPTISLIQENPRTELAAIIRGHLSSLHADGLRGVELKERAISDALLEVVTAKKREVLAHVQSQHHQSCREMRRRLDSVDADSLVRNAIGGSARFTSSAKILDLEVDLTKGI